MFIIDYQYLTPNVLQGDHNEIEGITREDYATNQYILRTKEIVLTKPTAVLLAGGVAESQSEGGRDITQVSSKHVGSIPYNKSKRVLRETSSYSLHRWIGAIKNNHFVEYANINHNSCASSMYSICEAYRLLESNEVEEVIVIAEERTSFNTIRTFKEQGIPITVSDGFAIMRFGKKGCTRVTETKWKYLWERNPFGTSSEGYRKVASDTTIVKPHGTGTKNNENAEEILTANKKTLYYKPTYGHMQGASTLVEMCLVLDDDTVKDDVLCVAAGLGGFYGSCVLHKR